MTLAKTVEKDTIVGVIAAIAALCFMLALIGVGYRIDRLAAGSAVAFFAATIATVWAVKRA